MDRLEKAKEIIKENIDGGRCGIYNTRNIIGDTMTNLYKEDGLTIDICYNYSYFEVFGLTNDEFEELKKHYYAYLELESRIKRLQEELINER